MKRMWQAALAAAVALGTAGAQAGMPAPTAKDLTPAVQAFLAEHGDLCLAWYDWPRDLTAAQLQSGMNEAVQMPVLERLGIVQSVPVPVPVADTPKEEGPARRYALTDKGRQYYLHRKHTVLNVHNRVEEHDADFCVAHLSLDRVVRWSPPESVNGQLETQVHYTYHIKAAAWMADPQARQVLPVIDRIIRGEGTLLMSATARLRDGKWVPVLPGQ